MPITKVGISNMYPPFFCEYCWSPLVGGCEHQCIYCYAKRMFEKYSNDRKWADIPYWASENYKKKGGVSVWKGLPTLPKGKIFVCHTTDLFANNIPDEWIKEILTHCTKFPESEFIFQTRNVSRIFHYLDIIPEGSSIGTTIETDLPYSRRMSKAPNPYNRFNSMFQLKNRIKHNNLNLKIYVTLEPIMKFGADLIRYIKDLQPDLVFIGCDTGKNNLPEPNCDELIALIEELRKITHVHIKSNCKRILGDSMWVENWKAIINKDMKGE